MLDFLFPWSLFVPFALWIAVRWAPSWNGRNEIHPPSMEQRLARLFVLWIVVFVVFFSLSSTKQDLYILPIVPALAALVGWLLSACLNGSALGTRPVVARILLGTGVVLPIVGASLVMLVVAPGKYPLAGVGTIGALLTVGGLATIGLTARRRPFAAAVAISTVFVMISWCFVLITLPDFERYKPVRPLAATIASGASDVAVIGSYGLAVPSLVFYLQRPVLEWDNPQQVRDVFSSSGEVYALMSQRDYETIRATLPAGARVLDSRPMLDARLNHLLDDTALPHIVLVSNRAP